MDLSLKDAITIVDAVKKLDWYSIWLWLSIAIPLYYIAFKKIISTETQVTHAETQIQEHAKNSSYLSKLAKGFISLFSVPRFEPIVLYTSMGLFVAGTILVIIGQQEKERIRNVGWGIKNYMALKTYYSMPIYRVIEETGVSQKDLEEVASQYPNEFALLHNSIESSTLIMTDSLPRKIMIQFSEKLLAAYLSNDSVLKKNNIKSFDRLFAENNLFTYEVVNRLIVDSAYRYTFNLDSGKIGKYMIVKKK